MNAASNGTHAGSGPLRAVFFDLDDTLCDTESLTPLRLKAVGAALQGAVEPSLLESVLTDAVSWDPLGRPGGKQSRLQRLGDALGLDDEERQYLRQVYNHALIENLRLYSGVRPLLTWLRRRAAVGLITNGPSDLQRGKLEALGIAPYFHSITISGEAGVHKPDPRIFRVALDSLSIEPADAIYIGDRPDVDVAGAQEAGIRTVRIANTYPFPLPSGPEADHTVKTIAEFGDLLHMPGWLPERPQVQPGIGVPPQEAHRG